ncbi:flagellar hook-associated protein FlgK [Cellulomonas sp. APG4]|uniref:flagellar hook-associated protein FlgK n=1 Tax=Cellulomonas sp. APG4 TaxID=1538656 RepID=UPI001379925C|nr:flagellar hook-associated protein FlgK [Cellulomonas sp. APG4]NCT91415.1 flagellar hook-associated protein FlgK [Cellulomonas sp. APG4]
MSSFAGLSTALSSLIAQRAALEVSGQNVANANTKGYTRQRADMSAVQALSAPSMFSSAQAAGNGVKVTGITRMGDVFLDARVRAETSSSSFAKAQAQSLSRLESTIAEPSDTGVATQLQKFWAGWQEVGNRPDDAAARNVLLGDARALVEQVASGYRAVETQWSQMRTEADTLVVEVNSTAQSVADFNERIRAVLVSGGSANELIDQRNVLVTKLSELVGAQGREREDGTLDVMVGGNALVRGTRANPIEVTGSYTMGVAIDGTNGQQVALQWVGTGTALPLDGGKLASHLADLSPSGLLANAAASWNGVAQSLADTVNPTHAAGATVADPTVAAGTPFFGFDAGPPAPPAALGLHVAITDADDIAAATPGQGALDGSNADAIARLADAVGGPDALYRAFVVQIGVDTRAATQRATVTEASRATAENLQLSNASVDLDEESVNMLAYQRAYEGAARVLTAVDEMLDVLINRTGVVGR